MSAVPQISGLHRPRIDFSLQRILQHQLGLIVANHGSGKTAALAHWAKTLELPVTWIRAYRPDQAPGVLAARIVREIAEALGLEDARDFDGTIRRIREADSDVVVVVDDFEYVLECGVEQEIENLLIGCGRRVHMAVLSRRPTSFNLARTEMCSFSPINTEGLLFVPAEARELFRRYYNRRISGADALALVDQTGGTPGALHLINLATAAMTELEFGNSLHDQVEPWQSTREYVEGQVLAWLQPEEKNLLLRCADLPLLSAQHCDLVLGSDNSADILMTLQKHLVIFPVSRGVFRVRVSVQSYLSWYRKTMFNPSVIAAERRHVADLMCAAGELQITARMLALAGEWDRLNDLIRQNPEQVAATGACSWIAGVSAERIDSSPWLQLVQARNLYDLGYKKAAEDLSSKLKRLLPGRAAMGILLEIWQSANLWQDPRQIAEAGPASALRMATVSDPGAQLSHFDSESDPLVLLARGLTLQMSGNQSASRLYLRTCAAQRESVESPTAPLIAELVLAVVGPLAGSANPYAQATEASSVARRSYKHGLKWIGRLANGIAAALTPHSDSEIITSAVIAESDERGDDWTSALVLLVQLITRLRDGRAAASDFDELAGRFETLGAGTLLAWTLAMRALVGASRNDSAAISCAQQAVEAAQLAAVPGALAIAQATLAQAKGDPGGELMRSARDLARANGLVWRPWTWLQHRAASAVQLNSTEAAPQQHALRCFGKFQLTRAGELVDLGGLRPQARTILMILSVAAGKPVHRERIAYALWPENSLDESLHRVQVSISNLRRILEPERLRGQESIIQRQGEAYALDLTAWGASDVVEFESSISSAMAAMARQDAAAAATGLSAAVELYNDELLPEEGPAEWVIEYRERFRLEAAQAAETGAAVLLSLAKYPDAVRLANRCLEIDEWRDDAWRVLIEAHQRSGNTAAAAKAAQNYARVLEALGVPDSFAGSA